MRQNNLNNNKHFLSKKSVIRNTLTIGLLTMILGLLSVASPVLAKTTETSKNNVESTIKSWRFGPYATHRRAIEVRNFARRKGYKAKVVPAGSIIYGSRVYYVNVWR